MKSKILVIGINPSSDKKIKKNSSIDKLNKWMSFLNYEHYSFINVINTTGKYTKNKVDYKFVSSCSTNYNKIIALGNFVSNVLDELNINHFVMPHPSPLNRKLNDKDYEKQILIECKKWIQYA